MAELFEFRCPGCGKLLGAPARMIGRAIRCPRCGSEQVVPRPSDAPPGEDDPGEDEPEDAVDLGGLGIDLGLGGSHGLRPVEALKPARRPEAADVGKLVDEYLRSAAIEPGESRPADPADEDPDDQEPDAEPIVSTPTEPLTPGSGRRGRRATGSRAGSDVVLPRTAAVAWSLFALLALGLSFVAGLLVGHYRWR